MLFRLSTNPCSSPNSGGSRRAATLTEVLVAIFIMGIGLLALLSLFPLGALSMAQAIKDDRTAHAANNAFAIAEMFNIHNDPLIYNVSPLGIAVVPPPTPPANSPPANSSSFFLNPYPSIPQAPFTPGLPPDLVQANWDGPGYPVYVDPMGWKFLSSPQVGNPTSAALVGPGPSPPLIPGPALIPRMPLSFLANNQTILRWCTLPDDINFTDNALPPFPTVNQLTRGGRYSYAWMMRRPKAPVTTVMDISVVVYSGRSLATLGESVYNLGVDPNTLTATSGVRFDPNVKFVDVVWNPAAQVRPPVRRGSWILDATLTYRAQTANGPANIPDPHGFFYRVVEVTDIALNNSPGMTAIRLELQTNPKAASFVVQGGNVIPYGVLIVMENVVEVFDKGQGWKP